MSLLHPYEPPRVDDLLDRQPRQLAAPSPEVPVEREVARGVHAGPVAERARGEVSALGLAPARFFSLICFIGSE